MKKRVIGIILVLLLCLTGCGADHGDAETAFNTMMNTFKTGDVEAIKAYYDFSQESKFVNSDVSDEMVQMVFDTMKEMEYQVENVEVVDDNTVRISTVVTTLDFSQVINLYMEQLIFMVEGEEYQNSLSEMEQEDYQELIAEQMTEILSSEDIDTEEKTVTVTMLKQEDGTWVPGEEKQELCGVLFENLLESVNSLL